MINHHLYILSGAMGGGKSTILARLQAVGVRCAQEPARAILAEQRLINASGVPEQNADLFTQLMLSRSMHTYADHSTVATPTVFDRGIPDMLAYARLFGLDEQVYMNAAAAFRYNPTVFYFPAWEEIYTTDAERRMSFTAAQAFGTSIKTIYEALGYQLLEVPRSSIDERVAFIVDRLTSN